MNAPALSFDPSTDSTAFRGALGSFATGITVVTTLSQDDGPVAIVANSFASVSLDPPLVLWSPAKASKRFKYFADAPRFAIHVLSAEQRDLCAAIAQSVTAIADAPMRTNAQGIPILDAALATFECTLETSHDAGDHVIVVGRVLRADHRPGRPLVFHGGTYGELQKAS